MNFKILLRLMFVIAAANYAFACDCYDRTYAQAKVQDYNKADVIFIGDALKTPAKGIVIKVTEVLKGDLPDTVAIEENPCISPMHIGERWLVYAVKKSDKVYSIIGCSLSRSFSNPVIVVAKDDPITFPAPGTPSPGENELKLSRELQLANSKIKLYEEIGELRKKRYDLLSQQLARYKMLVIALSALSVVILLTFIFKRAGKQKVS